MQSLIDNYGRAIDYLRISVTDRCNLRCFYCMEKNGVEEVPHDEILRYEDILEIIRKARELGFKRFRITGGEPLVRRGLLWFLERLGSEGVNYSITTNGILLARFARDLRKIGLKRINIGLDTLKKDRFHKITRFDDLRKVLKGIDSVRAEGIPEIKVNVVVMRGVNDDEIDDFLEWGRRKQINIRFIEFMPVYGKDLFVSLAPFIESFRSREDVREVTNTGGGPARSFAYKDGEYRVGFILPRTEPFCSGCNRLRLTSDGTLLPCLFSREGVNLKSALRKGGDIAALIIKAVKAKSESHGLNMKLSRYGMYALGG